MSRRYPPLSASASARSLGFPVVPSSATKWRILVPLKAEFLPPNLGHRLREGISLTQCHGQTPRPHELRQCSTRYVLLTTSFVSSLYREMNLFAQSGGP